ncbi:MAG: dephospho-CoA kinase [Acidimicrobiia bacterium]|nr:dephospho-CoA kinase [Acidimicrobiia bacterium]
MRRCSIALLGGIGSGKSTVGRLLADLGAYVVDADSLGHAALAGAAKDEVAREWPEVLVDDVIDRARLATIVFGDLEQLRRLESITHPHIRSRIAELVGESDVAVVVVELPVISGMLEGRWLQVVVDVPDHLRLGRLIRRGMSKFDAQARMNSQPSRAEWLAAADFVIDNSGGESQLIPQMHALMDLIAGCIDE